MYTNKMATSMEKYYGCEAVKLLKEANSLSDVDSKNDPQNEPFKSKYTARELYKQVRDLISEHPVNAVNKDQTKLLTLLCVDLLLGQNYVDTEEVAEGEEYFSSILSKLQNGDLEEKECISLAIYTLNSLGIVSSERGDWEKCMHFITQAEKRYLDYKTNHNDPPINYQEFLQTESDDLSEEARNCQRNISFENLYTHTLYYLAQGYGKQNASSQSAYYCHLTLHRQLNSGVYDPIEWGLNSVTLSQYYITVGKFTEARHCLSSGSFTFDSSKKATCDLSEEEAELQEQKEADIKRCWIKYGLALLENSRDKMLQEVHEMDDDALERKLDDSSDANSKSALKDENDMKLQDEFQEFTLEVKSYEQSVTDTLVRVFDDARKVFLFIIDMISKAKLFYSLDSHALDFVELIQDNSKAYKLLAFFELDMERQCKMHKRRIDMLASVLKELNPKYYLLICRQLMFEIAEAYSSMVDLKATLMEMDKSRVNPQAVSKINKLIEQSIHHYQQYIDSLRDKDNVLPAEFPEGDVRPALVAYFCIGRLYTKIFEPDVAKRIALMMKSIDYYKKVVDYCKSRPASESLVSSEYSICKEMVELLPLKIERLKQHGTSA